MKVGANAVQEPERTRLITEIGAASAVVWCVVLTFAGRVPTALGRGQFDAQLFAYIGLRWSQGVLPYAGHWDVKPPGIFLISRIGESFFPGSFVPLAVLEGAVILAAIIAAYRLLRLWEASRGAAAMTAMCLAVAANLHNYNEGGNLSEIYVLAPAAFSMVCFSKAAPRFRGWWIFAAGACTGLAVFFKLVGLAPFLAQSAFLLWLGLRKRHISISDAMLSAAQNAAGIIAVWVPVVVYFWRAGALNVMLQASFVYPFRYGAANQHDWMLKPLVLLYLLAPVAPLVAGMALLLAWTAWGKAAAGAMRLRFWLPLALAWLAFDTAGALAGGVNYEHYLLCMMPSLSVVTGLSLAMAERLAEDDPMWQQWRLTLAVLVLVPLFFVSVRDIGQMVRQSRRLEVIALGDWRPAADYLSGVNHPGDTLFVWPYLPGLYFQSQLPGVSRYLTAHYSYDFPRAYSQIGGEIMADLDRKRPTYMVDCESPCVRGRSPGVSPEIPDFVRGGDPLYQRFRLITATEYVPVYRSAGLVVYRKKP